MSGWSVSVTVLPDRAAAHGDRGRSTRTHRVRAVDATRERTMTRDLTAAEAAAFDPDEAWRVVMANRRAR